jgi:hypothetical protein
MEKGIEIQQLENEKYIRKEGNQETFKPNKGSGIKRKIYKERENLLNCIQKNLKSYTKGMRLGGNNLLNKKGT